MAKMVLTTLSELGTIESLESIIDRNNIHQVVLAMESRNM
jgi:hypothetical protein